MYKYIDINISVSLYIYIYIYMCVNTWEPRAEHQGSGAAKPQFAVRAPIPSALPAAPLS